MNFEELKKIIEREIRKAIKNDSHLYSVNTSERSMTFSLAAQMRCSKQFPNHHIDCEYSRTGEKIKSLEFLSEKIDAADVIAKTVYPDIIIHTRGKEDSNLLVIEAKKYARDQNYDEKKIVGYIEELKYKYGLLLRLPAQGDIAPSFEWWYLDNKGHATKAELTLSKKNKKGSQ